MTKSTRLLLVLMGALGCAAWAVDAPPPAAPPSLPAKKVNPKDGAEMVLVPAGEFQMGTSEDELAAWLKAHPDDKRASFTNELPQHKVDLDAFYIYKTEVTVAQYRQFSQATGRKMPREPIWKWQNDQPMVNVAWADAQAYADWAGVALPTEAQWEKAARGTDGRVYPWGSMWDAGKCCNSIAENNPEAPAAVGSFPAGASPYGVLDMTGNVWEWCADWYGADYYQHAPTTNPTGPATGTARVVRGGSLGDVVLWRLRAAVRDHDGYPKYWYSYIGFRCAACLPAPPAPPP